MKFNIYIFLLIAVFSLFASSCKKQEPVQKNTPKVVNLTVKGSTTVALEFVYQGKVIYSTPASNGSFVGAHKIALNDQDNELKIREQGSANFIATHLIKPTQFDQTVSIYYDGNEIYNQSVMFEIKGVALSGELEFLIDDKVIHEGTGRINTTISIFMNENNTKKVDVRLKGTTTSLITKTIEATPTTGQSLSFFFDGIKIDDNFKLDPPSNPAKMGITAQFKSTVTPPSPVFLGGEVDLVFYIRNTATNVIAKTNPEIKVPISSDGSFTSFELPALPGSDFEYSFDIYQRGTNNLPYDASKSPIKVLQANEGRYGDAIAFAAGKSKLLLINDGVKALRKPKRVYVPIGKITDLLKTIK